MVKNPLANARISGDLGSLPESGRFPGRRNGNYSSILARIIPGTKEPGWL